MRPPLPDVVFVLTLLVVAGAFAIFQWGGRVLLEQRGTPSRPFRGVGRGRRAGLFRTPPTGSPGRELAGDPARLAARRRRGRDPSGDAAVFYIHPTTYLERDRWNAPLHPGGDTEFRTRLFVQSQASAFNERRRHLGAALPPGGVRRLPARQQGRARGARPRLLRTSRRRSTGSSPRPATGRSSLPATARARCTSTGCSGRRSRDKPIAKRIVAAYVVGWPLSVTAPTCPRWACPPCAAPDQTGCMLSWMSFADPANPDLVLHSYLQLGRALPAASAGARTCCASTRSAACATAPCPPQANPGTLVPSADLLSGDGSSRESSARIATGGC